MATDPNDHFFAQYREKILPSFLSGKLAKVALNCYAYKEHSKENLDAGYNLGLKEGEELGRLLGTYSSAQDAIEGARYLDKKSGIGRDFWTDIDPEEHQFIYGLLHGLEVSTTINSGRDTESDVCRALQTVLKNNQNLERLIKGSD